LLKNFEEQFKDASAKSLLQTPEVRRQRSEVRKIKALRYQKLSVVTCFWLFAVASLKGRSHMQFEFIPPGTDKLPVPGKIILDVGNRLCPGVLDHHQPDAGDECATSLVQHHPNYVLDHLKDTKIEDITIVTHIVPDLDAMTSAFFAHSLLSTGQLPLFSEKISAYVRDVDMGVCFRYPDVVVTVYSMFKALCQEVKKEAQQKGWPADEMYRKQMDRGFSLWEYVISVMDQATDLHGTRIFDQPHPFPDAHKLVQHDHAIYLKDLDRSQQTLLTLPHKNESGSSQVDGLFMQDPESILFPDWARGDNQRSSKGKGFILLAVNFQSQRYIISVDPQSIYSLKGLGYLLEEKETQKRQVLGKERTGEPRPGYDNSDPWYDGRNPLHNYTIIDTPRNGSVLEWSEIIEIVNEFSS
jgi:hypothetical protein